jgi:hypothetical protein
MKKVQSRAIVLWFSTTTAFGLSMRPERKKSGASYPRRRQVTWCATSSTRSYGCSSYIFTFTPRLKKRPMAFAWDQVGL